MSPDDCLNTIASIICRSSAILPDNPVVQPDGTISDASDVEPSSTFTESNQLQEIVDILKIADCIDRKYIVGDSCGIQTLEDMANNGDTSAMVKLGNILLIGGSVDRDPSAAFRWFNEAAEEDDEVGKVKAADCLLLGVGTNVSELPNYANVLTTCRERLHCFWLTEMQRRIT